MQRLTDRHISARQRRLFTGNMMFLLPTIILFTIVVIIPFVQGIPYSFTNWKSIVSAKKAFIGFKNYAYLLGIETGSGFTIDFTSMFWQTLGVTFKFTLLYTLSSNIMGLMLALLIHRSSWFNNISRTILFLPFTVSVTAGAIVWKYVFTDFLGYFFNITSPLGMPGQLVYGMVIIAAWRDMGYTMLIYIAGLQAIPQDYYEAATVDGANGVQRFFNITIPLLVPAFTTNITLLLAWGLRTFDMPMVVASDTMEGKFTAVYVYQCIFQQSKAGLGQAAAILLTIVLIVLTQVVTRYLRGLEVEA